jgi:hypothetical protein
MAVLAEVLPDSALDPIAHDGPAGDTNANGEAEPWMVQTVQSGTHEKERVGRTQPRALHGIELRLRE